MIYVERIRESQSSLYRRVRLEALGESPDSFSETLDEEQSLSLDAWGERTRKWARSDQMAGFFALQNGKPVGLIGVVLDTQDPTLAIMCSFWVHPGARGSDAARLLVETVMDWARSRQAVTLASWVLEDNERALSFYDKTSFRKLDDRRRHEKDPTRHEMLMVKPLSQPVVGMNTNPALMSEDVISLHDYMSDNFDRVSA